MALKAGGDYRFELDGQYVCFRLFDPGRRFCKFAPFRWTICFSAGQLTAFATKMCRALFSSFFIDATSNA